MWRLCFYYYIYFWFFFNIKKNVKTLIWNSPVTREFSLKSKMASQPDTLWQIAQIRIPSYLNKSGSGSNLIHNRCQCEREKKYSTKNLYNNCLSFFLSFLNIFLNSRCLWLHHKNWSWNNIFTRWTGNLKVPIIRHYNLYNNHCYDYDGYNEEYILILLCLLKKKKHTNSPSMHCFILLLKYIDMVLK